LPLNMGAFVYAVTAADVVRLRHLRKRLQRRLSFVYAGILSQLKFCLDFGRYCTIRAAIHANVRSMNLGHVMQMKAQRCVNRCVNKCTLYVVLTVTNAITSVFAASLTVSLTCVLPPFNFVVMLAFIIYRKSAIHVYYININIYIYLQ